MFALFHFIILCYVFCLCADIVTLLMCVSVSPLGNGKLKSNSNVSLENNS